jgi:hypothetical protein
MTVWELSDSLGLSLLSGDGENRGAGVYCCDLLSLVMGRAPEGCVWVTVMGNVNAVAVASLREIACILLAEGMRPDEEALAAARARGICLMCGEGPVYALAKRVEALL